MRALLFAAVVLVTVLGAVDTGATQAYPKRPVRVLVGSPAGSSPDIVARVIAQWLSDRLGQPFVIENRPGAGSNLAAEAVVRAGPDGHTVLWVTAANAINATFYENLSFNFVRDIAPVAGIMTTPFVMEVNPSFPARTVPEFIAYAKNNPGKINMASAGNGTPHHVAGELFKMMSGVDMVHVPYRGVTPALTDLLSGQVQVLFDAVPASIGHIKEGRLRPLAVTMPARLPVLPDVPTLSAFLPGYQANSWMGIGVPKDTPLEVVDQLNREINAALADPRTKARLVEMGGIPLPGTSAEFTKLIAEETEKWAKVVKFSGAKPIQK